MEGEQHQQQRNARDPRAAYGRIREAGHAAGAAPGPYTGETYYGRPVLKPSPFDWKVSLYIYLAGLSGSSQVLATVADLAGGERSRTVVRNGRHIALIVVALGPPLLIIDLHTPQRFYNMLRIFRRTSPMSIGTYVLSGFSLFSVVAAAADFLAERSGPGQIGAKLLPAPLRRPGAARTLATAAGIPAALFGAGMSTYTAALLAATSTPLWSAAPRLLGVRFAGSAVATAAAALSLSARIDGAPESADTLDTVAAAATAVDLVASVAADREYEAEGVDGALRETKWGAMHTVGALATGAVLPLACYALAKGQAAATPPSGRNRERDESRRRRPSRGGNGSSSAALSVLASLAVLAGGLMTRHSTLSAGNVSAKRPRDYFRQAQPRLADGSRPAPERIGATPRYDVDPGGDGRLKRTRMPA